MTKQSANILWSGMLRRAVFVLVVSAFLAFSGIYGSEALPIGQRLLYWVALVAIGVWLGGAIFRQLEPIIAPAPWLVRWMVFSLALSAPMVGMVAVAQALSGSPVPAGGYLDFTLKVVLVTAGICGVRMLQADREIAQPVAAAPAEDRLASLVEIDPSERDEAQTSDADGPSPLVQRLGFEFRDAQIWALSAEDHYVRVHTDLGEKLILMRFADAVREAADIEGVQVHRSWWVSRAGVDRVLKRTEGGCVVLRSGTEAPVSRNRYAALIEKNWV